MADKNPHSGHRERMRNKFEDNGLSAFSEHEILELLLYYSVPRINTNEQGHRLIEHFGSINGVLSAEISELENVKGISESSAVLINLIGCLCRDYICSAHPNTEIISSSDISEYVSAFFANVLQEIYVFVFINAHGNIVSSYVFSSEQLCLENFSPKLFTSMIIRKDVDSFFIGHNRRNHVCLPGDSDYFLIKKAAECMNSFDVKLSDYIIFDGNKTFSMRDKGAFSF